MASERRFFVELPAGDDLHRQIALSESDSRHLADVLRAKVGDSLTVIDRSTARRFCAKVTSLGERVGAEILSEISSSTNWSPVKSVLFALSKGDTLDLVIQKCTELGVGNIHLWQSERSVVRLETRDLSKKLERYNKIAEGAAKQCNRSDIPKIYIGLNLGDALKNLTSDSRKLICSLHPEAKLLRTFPASSEITLAIGPEGGLTDDEESMLISNGFQRASLGPTILRCETAAIASVAMVNALWGNLE